MSGSIGREVYGCRPGSTYVVFVSYFRRSNIFRAGRIIEKEKEQREWSGEVTEIEEIDLDFPKHV